MWLNQRFQSVQKYVCCSIRYIIFDIISYIGISKRFENFGHTTEEQHKTEKSSNNSCTKDKLLPCPVWYLSCYYSCFVYRCHHCCFHQKHQRLGIKTVATSCFFFWLSCWHFCHKTLPPPLPSKTSAMCKTTRLYVISLKLNVPVPIIF